jgi:PAS domain S-box-containing protein
MALAEQESLLRLVTGLLPANVAYFDANERYRFVNETYRVWFGVDPASIVGKTAREFMGKRAYEICAPSLRKALAGEPCELEMDILNPAGGRRYLHARYIPDVAADGSIRGCVALINDVTGVREGTTRLEAALAARDDFVGFTTHELKTPLTVILGFADVLARRSEELGTNTVREIAELLLQDARRLDEIVENMLMLARADRGASDEPALVHRAAAKALNSRRWRMPGQQHSLAVIGEPGLVLAPVGWIETVIDNLVSNAEKYGDGSKIEVSVEAEPGHVCLRVMDRGRGVSEEQAAEVFEPFFRANPQEPGVPGIGLGLTVCRKLILRLGGEIWLRPRPGGGSEAGFRLPRAHMDADEA